MVAIDSKGNEKKKQKPKYFENELYGRSSKRGYC